MNCFYIISRKIYIIFLYHTEYHLIFAFNGRSIRVNFALIDLSVILLVFCKHHRHLLQEYMLLKGNTYKH